MIQGPSFGKWSEPDPAPGTLIVDVRFADGANIRISHDNAVSANRHADDACRPLLALPDHPYGVLSVAVYGRAD